MISSRTKNTRARALVSSVPSARAVARTLTAIAA
jgi:hypothetical protein